LILVGIETADLQEDIDWLVGKNYQIRIFEDENQDNLSVKKRYRWRYCKVLSQFTLHASTKKRSTILH
jgi:D-tyrosyl-tRNA(Tyr) deacylase